MQKLLTHIILRIIQNAGFEAVSKPALELLLRVYEDRICTILNIVTMKANFAARPSTSILDFMNIIEDPTKLLGQAAAEKGSTSTRDAAAFRKLFNVAQLAPVEYPAEEYIEPKEWTSPLSTRVEKFIHIYDFMPSFPPIHTFRLTAIKQPIMKNHSSKVKNRLEQSLKSESNMIKLIKSSGALPGYINFLYRSQR